MSAFLRGRTDARALFQQVDDYITTAANTTGYAVGCGSISPDDRRIPELLRHLERALVLAVHLRDHPEETP